MIEQPPRPKTLCMAVLELLVPLAEIAVAVLLVLGEVRRELHLSEYMRRRGPLRCLRPAIEELLCFRLHESRRSRKEPDDASRQESKPTDFATRAWENHGHAISDRDERCDYAEEKNCPSHDLARCCLTDRR